MIRPEPQLTEAFSIALHVEQVDTCFPEPLASSGVLFLYLVYRKKLTLEWDGSHGRQILFSLKIY